ncbi:hypothetical protein [Paenibacillus pini]|uniref:hypothetical protein n=1 Tax=Paenibacillus pini TaxID=669461 RepID=UPI000559CEAF|nr:hypothetical protein [Paenibacillus pini]
MNRYTVNFKTTDESEVGLIFEISATVNRSNNPTDEELIKDYLHVNYGLTVDYETLQCHALDDVVRIDEDYEIEI